jgi:hypothetical protein
MPKAATNGPFVTPSRHTHFVLWKLNWTPALIEKKP